MRKSDLNINLYIKNCYANIFKQNTALKSFFSIQMYQN